MRQATPTTDPRDQHNWLGLLRGTDAADLPAAMRRLAHLAAAAHRAEAAQRIAQGNASAEGDAGKVNADAAPGKARPAGPRPAGLTPATPAMTTRQHTYTTGEGQHVLTRKDPTRGHGRTSTAVDHRPAGGSLAKECPR